MYKLCIILIFSGVISCNGQDGTVNVGGASGGSIKLTTGELNGKGIIESKGGKGMITETVFLLQFFIRVFFFQVHSLFEELLSV